MKKKILILGANGMLGHVLFNSFTKNNQFTTIGTLRKKEYKNYFNKKFRNNLLISKDICNFDNLNKIIKLVKPDYLINCIGIIKQKDSFNYKKMILINSLLPRKLSQICEKSKTKLILISTDCVFLGDKGNYKEKDITDAIDTYGISKILGECLNERNLIIRTSIIGPELNSKNGLLEWFLSQNEQVNGFKNFYFSGVTTFELYNILNKYILNYDLAGIYHIGSKKINKFELLNIISKIYKKKIIIKPSYKVKIDRSLNFIKFKLKTGYKTNKWIDMIKDMYQNES